MTLALQLLLGTVTCGLFIVLARRFGVQREVRVYAVGLVVAAIVYLGFALNGSGLGWLFVELLGVAIFAVSASLGVKVSPFFLGLGWALHAAWDGWMHAIAGAGFVPNWYPPVCLGFDLVLAGYIFAIRRNPRPI
jgi:hypothetical protein